MFNALRPKRRWFQFSLGTLFVVVTVFSVWLGLQTNRANRQRRAVEAAVEAIHDLGGRVHHDYQTSDYGSWLPNQQPHAPRWLRDILGNDHFGTVAFVELLPDKETFLRKIGYDILGDSPRRNNYNSVGVVIQDQHVRLLQCFVELRSLSLHRTEIGDEGLRHLKPLHSLQALDLTKTRVTDRGLVHLNRLNCLRRLCLMGTGIGDAGLQHLGEMDSLEELDLALTQVSDEGLDHLKGLTHLRRLDIRWTSVTPDGATRIQEQLPQCVVNH